MVSVGSFLPHLHLGGVYQIQYLVKSDFWGRWGKNDKDQGGGSGLICFFPKSQHMNGGKCDLDAVSGGDE